MINLIASVSKNWCVGKKGKLPWHLPGDFKHFVDTTMGNTVVMGRKTYESLDRDRYGRKSAKLPGRRNVILTRREDFEVDGFEVINSLDEIQNLQDTEDDEIFIIGGASVYIQTLEIANRIYLTVVDTVVDGDTFFPNIEESEDWKLVSSVHNEPDEKNEFGYEFREYIRN